MNLFKSVLAIASGGGNGADLIVTCGSDFAGKTITCTNGSDYTETQECPSSSPYEVTFESIPTGTYTISGVISGQTFSTTKTITDFTALLESIPDGATVTPTDSIQTWLHCANIWDKNYTTIEQVLADASTLQALIASNNAADYMARSTSWASSVTANSSAMTYIGANNYCANKLLFDSTWTTAICNSTYFESVLNEKVPTMTSNTAPSGTASADSELQSTYLAYLAFNKNENDYWMTNKQSVTSESPGYVGYTFTKAITIKKMELTPVVASGRGGGDGKITRPKDYKIQVLSNENWVDIYTGTFRDSSTAFTDTVLVPSNNLKSSQCRILITSQYTNPGFVAGMTEVQFYGRA